jgi:hypothetical protein
MIQKVVLVISILVLGTAIADRRLESRKEDNNLQSNELDITQTPTLSASPTLGIPTSKPTMPKLTITPTRDSYQYPGSNKVSANLYTSKDPYESILEWYKGKLDPDLFNVRNVISTTTNGVSMATISARGSAGNLDVKISHEAGSDVTTIEIKQ